MDKGTDKNNAFSMPIMSALMMALLTGLVSGLSFVVIKYWPLPASVAPVFGFQGGFLWGAVIGAVTGLVIGYCVDDQNYKDAPKSTK
jgi:tetrahydromethanopterin S-methyltransferase subunit C